MDYCPKSVSFTVEPYGRPGPTSFNTTSRISMPTLPAAERAAVVRGSVSESRALVIASGYFHGG
jgi:hypothetical protein